MIGTIVETNDLLYTVAASLIAGLGVTASFSLLIFAVARFAELRRNERAVLATAAAGLGVAAFAITAAAIALGIVVMASE